MTKVLTTIAILSSVLVFSHGFRILVHFPVMSRSHSILGHGVVRHLLEAGHEVVHITSFPTNKPVENLQEINVSRVANLFDEKTAAEFKLKNMIGKQKIGNSLFFAILTMKIHERIMGSEEMATFLSDPKQKFDAVIVEWFFSELSAGIANVFDCPLIWFSPTEAIWMVLHLIDEIPNPAYNLDIMSDNHLPLGLFGRIDELWTLIKKILFKELYMRGQEVSLHDQLYSKIAASRGVTLPSFEESIYNASFMFINSHPSYGKSQVLPQNAKYIGGYHVEDKIPALPEDLQKLMDNSKQGVIYFSMGSNLQSKDMSEEMKASILRTFESFKQDVLWKFEGDLENVPKNVKLLKWAPQQSILAHPNLKVFVTHGGQLSTTEAVHHGVPLIGIPILGDQHVNMKSVVEKGFGVMVEIDENVADKIKIALNEVLEDPKYAKNAKEISLKYHDRPVKPGKELSHWVEHVIKTGGAAHLRPLTITTPFYQKIYLDVIVLVLIAIFAAVFGLKRLLRSFRKPNVKKLKKN